MKSIALLIIVSLLGVLPPVHAQNIIDINEEQVEIPENPQRDDVNTQLSDDEEDELFEEDRPVDINDNAKLRAQFRQSVQDPADKTITFELILLSNVNSDRVRITWEVTGQTEVLNTAQLQRTITVRVGETYAIPVTVRPIGIGVTEVKGKAELFEADVRTVTVVRKNYASNEAGEILPLTEDYEAAKQQYQLTQTFLNVSIVIVVLFTIFFGGKAFLNWYRQDEVSAYERRGGR